MNGNLVYPSFVKDLGDVNPVKPSLSEILRELVTATNFVRYPQHALVAFFFVYNFSLTFVLAAYFYWFFSMVSFVFMLLATVFLGTVYNTVWYHRYCSHAAFKFGKSWARALFLWTNPFVIKEETYAIPH